MQAGRPRLTWTLIAIVGALTLCPVAMLLLGSFFEGLNEQFAPNEIRWIRFVSRVSSVLSSSNAGHSPEK